MAEWFFRPKTEGELNREPVESEFFATNAIRDPGMALVREAIQNSLDERRSNTDTVLVRIRLSGDDKAVPAEILSPYLENAWEHLAADENGLNPSELPSAEEPCPYIVIEDFGTTGLEGDPAQAFRARGDQKNKFYHFFRAEGQSDKGATDRGSWGVGKCVFTRSSRINGMYGLTVRHSDGKRLMMGKITLKSHWMNGDYCQEGFFGIPPEGDDKLVMPVDDSDVLEGFAEAFDLQRGMEAGLSVVIPWPWDEINQEQVVGAVLRDYFWPVMAGQLEVAVETPDVEACLEAGSILEEAKRMGPEFAEDYIPLLEFAEWAIALSEDERVRTKMPDPSVRWQWSSELMDEDLIQQLREDFEQYRRLSVRVPVTVRPKEGEARESFFDTYFARDASVQRDRPTFVREGLIISNVDAPRTRGVVGLVIVEDKPLIEFLRDAENPSHTEWQHDGSKFKHKYVSGASDLQFVKRSIHEMVKIITEADKAEDITLLADVFSLDADEADLPVGTEPDEEDGTGPEEDTEGIPKPKPQPFVITKVRGGFSIAGKPDHPKPPSGIVVRAAYDTRRGSPLKRYNVADFQMDGEALNIEANGLTIEEKADNRVLARITRPDFRLTVTGFDENRDLYVRAERRNDGHAG